MAINECIPKYEPGADLSGQCTADVIGKRFLRLSGDKQGVERVSDDVSGGNVRVAMANPANDSGRIVGVSGYNATAGRKVKIVRGPGKVVPVEAGAAIPVFAEVATDAVGRAIPFVQGTTGRAVVYVIRAVTGAGVESLVNLYV